MFFEDSHNFPPCRSKSGSDKGGATSILGYFSGKVGPAPFIQTALHEWAYAQHWTDSEQRDAHLQPWTDYYNHARPHGSLNYKPPISHSETGTTS